MADNDVEVRFGASTSELNAATSEAQGKIGEFGEAVEGLKEPFEGIVDSIKEFGAAVGIAFGVDALVEWIKSSAELGEQLEHISAELGITAQQASQLRGEAVLTGTSFDALQTELERLQLNLASLDATNSRAAQGLKVLGINAQAFARLPLNGQIEQLSESFSRFADGPTKTAAAMALLGRAGAQLIPFLDRGKEGLDELNETIGRTGSVMSGAMVESFAKTEENINEMSLAWQGLSNQIFNAVNPAIQGVLRETIGLAESLNTANGQGAAVERELELLGDAAKIVAAAFIGLEAAVKLAFDEMLSYAIQAEDALSGVASILHDVWSGNWSAIAADAKQAWTKMGSDSDAIADQQVKTFSDAFDRIKSMFSGASEAASKGLSLPSVANMQLGGGADEALQAAMKAADGEVSAYQAAEKQKQDLIEAEVKTKQISAQAGVQAIQDALQDELQDTLDTYRQELALDGIKASQRQDILNKMQQAQQKYDEAVQQLNIKAAEQTTQEWQKAFNEINSAFDSQISGLLKGTTSWSQAFKNVLLDLTTDIIKFFVNWSLQAAESELLQIAGIGRVTAAQEAGSAAQASAQAGGAAAGAAASASSVLTALFNDAKATFGGVFAFLAPFMGPAAAGPAAAAGATVAAGGSFAVGSWELPSDMLAQVHEGEMIVPAAATPWAQDLMSNAARGGGMDAAGNSSFHATMTNHFHGSPMSETQILDVLARNGKQIMRTLMRQHPNFRP